MENNFLGAKLFFIIVVVSLVSESSAIVCGGCGRHFLRSIGGVDGVPSHICRPKKRYRTNTYSSEKESRVESTDGFKLSSIKFPNVKYNNYFSFDKKIRSWTSRISGRVIEGVWKTCTKDFKSIYIENIKSESFLKISVSSLIDSDKKYVEDRINDMKGRNYVWWEGGFFSMTDLKNIRKAEKIVMQRSVDTMNAVSFKIFQIVDEGALASFGVRGSYGMEYDLEKIFFLLAKIDNVVADTECLKGKLFWASTYKYINKKNDQRVIDCYALSFSEAVFRVRAKMGLFDETSQGFEAFVKSTPCEGDKKEIAPSSPETTSVIKMCSSGTGFFVTTNGYLVTNHHVIDGGKLCKVLTEKGIFEARIVKTDSVTDLALLKVDVLTSPCKFSTRRSEKLGTEIFTMGFPMPKYQGFSPKVTKGIISGVEGFKGDVREYQIDASIQPGNSGGPLFDVYGHIVGVLVASLRNGQLVNYAIKKSYVMAFLDNIEDCSFSLEEGEEGELNPLSEVVSSVQNSCALIMTYK